MVPVFPGYILQFYFSNKMITNITLVSGRVDNVYGDRNLICTLLPVSQMVEDQAAATA